MSKKYSLEENLFCAVMGAFQRQTQLVLEQCCTSQLIHYLILEVGMLNGRIRLCKDWLVQAGGRCPLRVFTIL
ncbi:hypothetical protein GCM10027417_27590 [Glutamicibacter endophyticus]